MLAPLTLELSHVAQGYISISIRLHGHFAITCSLIPRLARLQTIVDAGSGLWRRQLHSHHLRHLPRLWAA